MFFASILHINISQDSLRNFKILLTIAPMTAMTPKKKPWVYLLDLSFSGINFKSRFKQIIGFNVNVQLCPVSHRILNFHRSLR